MQGTTLPLESGRVPQGAHRDCRRRLWTHALMAGVLCCCSVENLRAGSAYQVCPEGSICFNPDLIWSGCSTTASTHTGDSPGYYLDVSQNAAFWQSDCPVYYPETIPPTPGPPCPQGSCCGAQQCIDRASIQLGGPHMPVSVDISAPWKARQDLWAGRGYAALLRCDNTIEALGQFGVTDMRLCVTNPPRGEQGDQDPPVRVRLNNDFDENKVDEDRSDASPVSAVCTAGVATDDMAPVWPGAWYPTNGPVDYNEFWSRLQIYLKGGRGALRVLAVWPGCTQPCPGSDCWAEIGEDDDIVPLYLKIDAPRGDWVFMVEGIAPGEATLAARGVLDGNRVREARARFLVVQPLDVDIDSDNTNGFAPPDRSPYEDRIEEYPGSPQYPGKLIGVNDGDEDDDGIPDYADWEIPGGHFTPVVIDLGSPVDAGVARLRIHYNPGDQPCDPSAVGPPPGYDLPCGNMRLWTADAPTARNTDSIALNPAGHYVPPGDYDVDQLPFQGRILTLYAEGLKPSPGPGGDSIAAEIDPDGGGTDYGFQDLDRVNVTVIKIDLDVDTNRNNVIDDNDESGEDAWTLTRGAIVLFNCDDDNQENGSITAVNSSSLSDSTKAWYPHQWQGGYVVITAGTTQGWRALVADNTADTLLLTAAGWTPAFVPPATPAPIPSVGSPYRVFDGVDADTAWVDGPSDHNDMAVVNVGLRAIPRLPPAWSVRLRASANVDRMRVWASEDLDGDRHLDVDEDTDHDGTLDAGEDLDGDGRLDVHEDFNGNGVLDTTEDANGNGLLDAGEDLNGNGRLDYIGALVVGHPGGAASNVTARTITHLVERGAVLYSETLSFPLSGFQPADVDMRLELQDPSGSVVMPDAVRVRVAPWLMIPHTQNAQTILAVQLHSDPLIDPHGDNSAFISDLGPSVRTINGLAYTETNGAYWFEDRWIQDEIEIGYTEAPYQRMHVALDSPRNRGLEGFAFHELLSLDFGWFECPSVGVVDTTSAFGNLEVSPPVIVGGVSHRLGRIVHGTMTNTGVVQFLASQDAQSPVAVNTSFLTVQHVDEIFSFIPGGGSQGFYVIVASPARATSILNGMRTDGFGGRELAVPPLQADPPLETIDCLVSVSGACDPATHYDPVVSTTSTIGAWANATYNSAVEAQISTSRTMLESSLGLTFPSDYLWVPVWFYDSTRAAVPASAEAYSVDLINGLFVAPTAFLAPNTYGPIGLGNRFTADIHNSFSAAGLADPGYVNDWHWYHRATGEVHCGTNAIRVLPSVHWWNTP